MNGMGWGLSHILMSSRGVRGNKTLYFFLSLNCLTPMFHPWFMYAIKLK